MHFLRLIRPINLAIIAITMYGVLFYLISLSPFLTFNYFDFALLVGSTILIAAAGNVINDYFDIRADRINKPNKVIISKHIKRRWAILLHWGLSGVAFLIALYLSWKYRTFWFSIIHLVSISLLWWYSVKLKKVPFIGNAVISGLTVLVIFLVLIFVDESTNESMRNLLILAIDPLFGISTIWIILIFMGMAFFQNLMREIVKDAEDIKGDIVLGARTIPMILGVKLTLNLVGLALMLFPIAYFIGIIIYYPNFNWKLSIPISFAALLNGFGFILTLSNQGRAIVLLKWLLKITMFSGLIYLFQYV